MVRIVVAASRRGGRGVVSAEVSGGRTIVDQDDRPRSTTDLTLSGRLACPGGVRMLVVRAGDGRFRTRTKRAAAAGRRSAWLTEDRCGGKAARVVRGRVTVEDFARRRTVLVRARGSYRAAAPAR